MYLQLRHPKPTAYLPPCHGIRGNTRRVVYCDRYDDGDGVNGSPMGTTRALPQNLDFLLFIIFCPLQIIARQYHIRRQQFHRLAYR